MINIGKLPMQTNLECFLDCTTPVVPSQLLSKSEMRKLNRLWHPWDRESLECFTLGDLWKSFDEWSACGAGVPIMSDDGQNLIQYFVPYLSAIQIFTSSSNSSANSFLRDRVETDSSETRGGDWFSDSFSDESERWDGSSSSEEGLSSEQDNNCTTATNFWPPNEGGGGTRLGNLYFHYFEKSSPYGRVPLTDKISSLAQRYPGLKSLRSVDLSPASWMAVAWYPIYHIPAGRTVKDLQTCFLTYHTLSSSFQDMDLEDDGERKRKEGEGISLAPFGLASYKMQGQVWISDKIGQDQERLLSMLNVADSWLKQLQVQHHDFNYFTGIRRGG